MAAGLLKPWLGLGVTPALAALFMASSSSLVVLSSLGLKLYTRPGEPAPRESVVSQVELGPRWLAVEPAAIVASHGSGAQHPVSPTFVFDRTRLSCFLSRGNVGCSLRLVLLSSLDSKSTLDRYIEWYRYHRKSVHDERIEIARSVTWHVRALATDMVKMSPPVLSTCSFYWVCFLGRR